MPPARLDLGIRGASPKFMQLVPISPRDPQIDACAQALQAGEVVAFPTETVYGLGANALDPAAVARVFEIKGRPRFDPLIVHLPSAAQAAELVEWSPLAQRLAAAFWPGPLTLVLPRQVRADGSPAVPDIVTAGLPTVGVRVPRHPLALALLTAAGRPIAAPSANPFGRISPTTAQHVRDQLGEAVRHILDGGPCEVGVESTVLSLAEPGPPRLLRPGGVPLEALREVVGEVLIGPAVVEAGATTAGFAAPGMLPRHYAPTTQVLFVLRIPDELPPGRVGLIALTAPDRPDRFAAIETLSPTSDLRQAAAGLFAALRRLDALPLDAIIALAAPEAGLGRAINDRLQRASHAE